MHGRAVRGGARRRRRGRRVLTRRGFVAGLAAGAAAGTTHAAAAQSLTVAEVHPGTYPTVAALTWIDEQLEARFAGELRLRVYHSGTLGSEKDTLELARIGALAVTRVHSSVLNHAVPATRILSLPYVFDSTEHMRRAFDGSFGDEILAACARRGLLGLAIYDSGSRNFYNTRHPVEAPSDRQPHLGSQVVGHPRFLGAQVAEQSGLVGAEDLGERVVMTPAGIGEERGKTEVTLQFRGRDSSDRSRPGWDPSRSVMGSHPTCAVGPVVRGAARPGTGPR